MGSVRRLWYAVHMRNDELREIEQAMAHWGFAVFDPVHPRSPGFRRLVIAMRPTPTYEHFDPEQLTLQIWGRQQVAEVNHWGRHVTLDGERRVVPGQVVISDRVRKQSVFYTFGATVQVAQVEGHGAACTYFVIDSAAPILGEGNGFKLSAEDQLVEDAGALFARLRAKAHVEHRDFERQLVALSPIQVYAGCIESLWDMYHHASRLPSVLPELKALLRREREWLTGQLNSCLQPLEQMIE